MTQDIIIGGRPVGPSHPPFIIAEMSGNHNQSLDQALRIVDAAADAGASAVKLQTYTAEGMTMPGRSEGFLIDDGGLWDGKTLYELYREAATPWAWHAPILDRCRARGIVGFSSVFHPDSVAQLEALDVPAYKISSLELTDVELVAAAARTGKPLIISTGMATLGEIDETVRAARDNGCRDLILLRCTSAYPAKAADANLRAIPQLRALFGCQVGLSDHTMGSHVAVAAVALGATVVEKHVTLSRADGGVDAAFSLEPAELARLVEETGDAREALGEVRFGASRAEGTAHLHRRSLYVVEDVRAGETFTERNLRAIRPGLGLPVKHRPTLLGMRAGRAIKAGTPMDWSLLGAAS